MKFGRLTNENMYYANCLEFTAGARVGVFTSLLTCVQYNGYILNINTAAVDSVYVSSEKSIIF